MYRYFSPSFLNSFESAQNIFSAKMIRFDLENAKAVLQCANHEETQKFAISLIRPPFLIIPSIDSKIFIFQSEKRVLGKDLESQFPFYHPIHFQSIDYMYFASHQNIKETQLKLIFSRYTDANKENHPYSLHPALQKN